MLWIVKSPVLACVSLITCLSSVSGQAGGSNIEEYCERESFKAECGKDEVIVITHAVYGRQKLGRCVKNSYGNLGCSTDVLDRVHKYCSGRPKCEFLISELHDAQPCPNDLMAYLEAAYECRKVTPCEKNMCDRGGYLKIPSSFGYLSSYVTSQTGCGSTSCPWTIEPKPGQHLNITFHNYNKPDQSKINGKYCHRYASVIDKNSKVSKDITVCAYDDKKKFTLVTETSAPVEIKLFVGDPQDESQHAAFLLEYKAVGCPDIDPPDGATITRTGDTMQVKCKTGTRSWHLTCGGSQWVGEPGTCSQDASQVWNIKDVFEEAGTTPTGLVVVVAIGVALGVILGFTMLAIAIVYMKKKHRNQYERAESSATQSAASTKVYDKQVPTSDMYYRSYQSRGSLPRPNTRVTASNKSLPDTDYPIPPPYYHETIGRDGEVGRRGREHVYESPNTFVGQSPGSISANTENTSLSRTSAIV